MECSDCLIVYDCIVLLDTNPNLVYKITYNFNETLESMIVIWIPTFNKMKVGSNLRKTRQEKLGVDTSYLEQASELREKLKNQRSKSLGDGESLGSMGPSNLQVGSTGISPALSHGLASAGLGALMGVVGGMGGMSGMGPMPGTLGMGMGMGGMPGMTGIPALPPMAGMRGMAPMGGMGRPMMR
ncbi:uncharacterized protein TA17950 [Theileria annulata]|uniref:Uncharacterized protein n=1 Tax=Theileria annulata TaxID=5874 RepID=Q4UB59_THEAN|nr:uncharacterized protein TA17950 [Theileria annulata]CAI75942.1 hypothetical protein TA17950 [Theileria annulata]|eukprot:XP_955418.1 hypothetical protein TA17950 [Theileria annulata]